MLNMLDRKFTSLTKWTEELMGDDLFAMIIGCSPDSFPPLGSYFDFINRLWLLNPDFEKSGRNDLFPAGKNRKLSSKPGKGKKLSNRHPGITKKVADYALTGRDFYFYYEKTLQKLFFVAVIVPSIELGLINSENLTVSGDGTCVHSHANPYGHRVCKCAENGIFDCYCPCHYSDPDASWSWDSDLNAYFYGHTLYMLSCHNEQYQTNLPPHIRFFDAKRHDSVSSIVALAEFRKINPDLQIKNICMDSANDNYPTYELCKEWNIAPFIDLNLNRGRPETIPKHLNIVSDGTPLCVARFRMVYWGTPKRHDCKWRCPVTCGKEDKCTCEVTCSSSSYGRCLYTKPDWDIRLYTPIPRGTEEYKKIYNNRTSSERINNRILNDYHLHGGLK